MSFSDQANEEIHRVILDEWITWQRPLLISQLGSLLSPPTKAAISETGHGLKRYIQESLEDRVRLVPMKNRGGSVAPLKETRDYSDAELEELYNKRSEPVSSTVQIPMYWGDVWRGFQKDLDEGSVRYIIVEPSGRPVVVDAPEGAALPEHAKLIERSDLVLSAPGEARPSRMSVQQAIENWCVREGVPSNTFEFIRPQYSQRPEAFAEPAKKTAATVSSKNDRVSSLMRGIDLLNREELARISIPADLVLAILERSSSR
jgi:hypothetical protein